MQVNIFSSRIHKKWKYKATSYYYTSLYPVARNTLAELSSDSSSDVERGLKTSYLQIFCKITKKPVNLEKELVFSLWSFPLWCVDVVSESREKQIHLKIFLITHFLSVESFCELIKEEVYCSRNARNLMFLQRH